MVVDDRCGCVDDYRGSDRFRVGDIRGIFIGTNFGAFLLYFGLPLTSLTMLSWQAVTALRVASKGDTIGHRLMGLRMVRVDGEWIDRHSAVLRHYLGSPLLYAYLTPMVVLVPVSIFLPQLGDSTSLLDRFGEFTGDIASVWLYWGLVATIALVIANHALMIFDRQGQGWHDKLAGTVVVRNLKRDAAYAIADAGAIDQN